MVRPGCGGGVVDAGQGVLAAHEVFHLLQVHIELVIPQRGVVFNRLRTLHNISQYLLILGREGLDIVERAGGGQQFLRLRNVRQYLLDVDLFDGGLGDLGLEELVFVPNLALDLETELLDLRPQVADAMVRTFHVQFLLDRFLLVSILSSYAFVAPMPEQHDLVRRVQVPFQHLQRVERGTDLESADVLAFLLRFEEKEGGFGDHHVEVARREVVRGELLALEHSYEID